MPEVRIRISAALDPAAKTVFAPLEQSAARAQAKIRGGAKATGDAIGGATRAGVDKSLAALTRAAAKEEALASKKAAAMAAASDKASQAIVRAEQKAAAQAQAIRQKDVNSALRAFDQKIKAAQAEEREILRTAVAEKAEKRAATKAGNKSGRERAGYAREFGHRSVSNLTAMAKFGAGLAGDVARGAGVRWDASSLMERNVNLESQATATTLSAFAAKGKVAAPEDVKKTINGLRSAGDETSTGFNEMGAGLDEFVSKTGDLETANELLVRMGKLAKVTGSDLGDVMSTAGEVANQFKDVEAGAARAEKVDEVMRALGKQGASGAVELKDLATYGARLAGPASSYAGDRGKSIGQLGAIAQMAKEKGGATTAADATNASAAFTGDLMKAANLKKFGKAGINVWADEGHTKQNSPQDILKAMLTRTGGDKGKLAALLPNKESMKGVAGFADVFNTAGGGAKGIEAVNAKFTELASSMSKVDVDQAFKTSQSTTASKAQDIQNRLDRMSGAALEKLVPALEKAGPAAAQFAELMTSAVGYAADNPGKAITAAIVASIAKSGIETALRAAITAAVTNASGGGGGATPAGAAAGAGPLATVAGVAVAAGGGFMAGKYLVDADKAADDKAERRRTKSSNEAINARADLSGANSAWGAAIGHTEHTKAREGQVTALGAAERQKSELEARISAAENRSMLDIIAPNTSAALNQLTAGSVGTEGGNIRQAQQDSDTGQLATLKADLAALQAEMAKTSGILSGTLQVQVMNPQGGGGMGVDSSGRTPSVP